MKMLGEVGVMRGEGMRGGEMRRDEGLGES